MKQITFIIITFCACTCISVSAGISSTHITTDTDTIKERPILQYVEVDSNFERDLHVYTNWYYKWLILKDDIPLNNRYAKILENEDEFSKEYNNLVKDYYDNNMECLPFVRDYSGAIDCAKQFVFSIICGDYQSAIDTSIYPNCFANMWESIFEKFGGKQNVFSNGHDIIDMRKIISEGYYPVVEECNRLDLGEETLNDQYYGFNIRFKCYNKDSKRYDGNFDDTVRVMVAQSKLPNVSNNNPEFYIIGYK